MSTFKKVLASVGIGAAKVDTYSYTTDTMPGATLKGEVYVIGGDVAQNIEQIYFYVATKYKRESRNSSFHSYEECKLLKHQVTQRFAIKSKEEKIIPVSIEVPCRTPLTLGQQEVYIRTGLDIGMAVNPKDWDYISVQPHPLMKRVLTALELLGFYLYEANCKHNVYLGRNYPFVQELEFRPRGKYQRLLDELEVIFYLEPNLLEMLLKIDRRARNLAGLVEEALDADESYARLYVSSTDLNQPLQNLMNKIETVIQRYIND